MPELHGRGFTDEQEEAIRVYTQHHVRDAMRPLRIRTYMALTGLIAGIVVGLLAYSSTQDKVYSAKIAANTARITAESARTRANCDDIHRLAAVLTIALPPHVSGRSSDQTRHVARIYARLHQLGTLNTNKCPRG